MLWGGCCSSSVAKLNYIACTTTQQHSMLIVRVSGLCTRFSVINDEMISKMLEKDIPFLVLHMTYKSLIFRKYSIVLKAGWVNRILKIGNRHISDLTMLTTQAASVKLQAWIQITKQGKLCKVIWLIIVWKRTPLPLLCSVWHNTVT